MVRPSHGYATCRHDIANRPELVSTRSGTALPEGRDDHHRRQVAGQLSEFGVRIWKARRRFWRAARPPRKNDRAGKVRPHPGPV